METQPNFPQQPYGSPAPQVIIVNPVPEEKPRNGIGTTGFVFSLISFFLGWIPYIGWALWFVGLLLSFIGVFKRPKGLAITGLIISAVTLIIIAILVVVIGSAILTVLGEILEEGWK